MSDFFAKFMVAIYAGIFIGVAVTAFFIWLFTRKEKRHEHDQANHRASEVAAGLRTDETLPSRPVQFATDSGSNRLRSACPATEGGMNIRGEIRGFGPSYACIGFGMPGHDYTKCLDCRQGFDAWLERGGSLS